MVQRKAPCSTIALHGDHLKSQHHIGKNRGGAADLKKKKMMKKSASIKRSEVESALSGTPTRRVEQKQPGKPPPQAATPQKLSPVSPVAKTPNYMKSTSSSDARKEKSRESFKSASSACSNLLISGPKSLKLKTLASGTMARTSSLKTMRTLTKNPSFKLARASVRKCSPIVLCENLESQRATCSSTLKDCKFPAYLSLNPGGTESEGTSAVKVCPYTYCSLNGHRHTPLPPLKCFLAARRRTVKAQRGINLGCLSPRRNGKGLKLDENFVMQDDVISPKGDDFFVEIFCKNKEDAGIDGSGSYCSIADHLLNKIAGEDGEERAVEMVLDGPIGDSVDVLENFYGNGHTCSVDVGLPDISNPNQNENQEVNMDEDVCCNEEGKLGLYETHSDTCDMDREMGCHSVVYLDDDMEYAPEAAPLDDNSCFDELMAEEESLNSYMFSSSHDGESTGSCNDMQSLNNVEDSADVEVHTKVAELAYDDEDNVLFGCNQMPPTGLLGNVGREISFDDQISLSNEDAVRKTGDRRENSDETGDFAGKGDSGNEADVTSIQISVEECHWIQVESNIEVSVVKSTELVHGVGENNKGKDAAKQEAEEDSARLRNTAKSNNCIEDSDELGQFNLRPPNFLPLEPDLKSEKIDLKHQEMDERKNTEEWMVDYALRQVVAKLGPARKRKVALLVEAFERVSPITKCELHMRHSSAFGLASPVQACR